MCRGSIVINMDMKTFTVLVNFIRVANIFRITCFSTTSSSLMLNSERFRFSPRGAFNQHCSKTVLDFCLMYLFSLLCDFFGYLS